MSNTHDLVAELAERLIERGIMMSTAESCTGGLIAAQCTDLPGSSRWLERAFVTYSNAAKTEMLGVPPNTLSTYGAVSENVVRAMATGAVARSAADVAVSVSGVAGPDGGSDEKPVGTVWLGFCVPDSASGVAVVDAVCHQFSGDRNAIRWAAASAALQGLLQRTKNTG
ncbi:MAG: CinA family protein [Pseudomonadota bacterium]